MAEGFVYDAFPHPFCVAHVRVRCSCSPCTQVGEIYPYTETCGEEEEPMQLDWHMGVAKMWGEGGNAALHNRVELQTCCPCVPLPMQSCALILIRDRRA